jgi:hypothetical protein
LADTPWLRCEPSPGITIAIEDEEAVLSVKYITRDEVVRRVTEVARRAGLTFDEFVADGLADELTDGDCRDHWLIYRDLLLDQ